ncbi:hypothetical protein [Paludibacterium purpuratum]|uniref:Uncharacterized protein n=1 Tax=Paludibacterium purpuratum TaxID=1144873 RepID=A0A4R7BDD4_9NEIS|nr:hypothetical protein [Paludibacterium purpuratum]TDR82192.1 hypothetical protein DFP86_102306 [Paludibacterium purpuratum]
MKTWYLQTDGLRQMIDDHLHAGFEEVDTCEAESWLQAKAILAGE